MRSGHVGHGDAVSFEASVDRIRELLRLYSSEDVATALFVSDIWLPNVASTVKHQAAVAAFASLQPCELAAGRRMSTYGEFVGFLERLYPLLPQFPTLEDYVPTPDWGSIRFHLGGLNYRFFYGCEIENTYDWLVLFQMVYGSLDSEYVRQLGRSPTEELRACLKLQDEVITGLSLQAGEQGLEGLRPGHLEAPPPAFWEQASSHYRDLAAGIQQASALAEYYTIPLGCITLASLEYGRFVTDYIAGRLLPCFFVSNHDQRFPVLARRWSYVLVRSWARILVDSFDEVDAGTGRYQRHIAEEMYHYLAKRIRGEYVLPFAGAVTEAGEPHPTVFAAAVISEDRLVLVYVVAPCGSAERIAVELVEMSPGLIEARRLMRGLPLKVALHGTGEIIELRPPHGAAALEPVLFVVLPTTSPELQQISVPRSLPARFMPLDQFLAMIDETTDAGEISSFIEYLESLDEMDVSPVTGTLDLFASFRAFHGVLVEGARRPTVLLFDPHWGSTLRHESLAEFWSLYPEEHYFDDPRSWRVEKETPSRLRLMARGYVGSAIHCQIGNTHVYIVAPFDRMSFEQARVTDLLMQCLEDSMSGFRAFLETHPFFKAYSQAHVNIFPQRLVADDPRLSHLRHLMPSKEYWRSDTGFVGSAIPGIRLVFDEEGVAQALETADDRSFEMALLLEVLTCMNSVVPNSHFSEIADAVSKHSTGPPRFRLFRLEKEVSFPELVAVHKPAIFHYKKARKRLAELAAELEIGPGCYEPEDAKENLNTLRSQLVREMDREVARYDYATAVPYLLERIDALSNEYERRRCSVRYSLTHEVDYEREHSLAHEHREYIVAHRAFRYVIEKFVQLHPQGSVALDKEGFQSLVALADVLQGLYMASDAIHYDVHAVGVEIDDDWLVQVHYEPELRSKELQYAREQAALDLGQTGYPDDRLDYVTPLDDYMDHVDAAFSLEMGFTLTNLLGVLRVLSQWAAFDPRVEESTSYSADAATIQEVCVQALDDLQREQVVALIEFLTLKPSEVIRIVGEDRPCEDVPVWEYRKRPWRYNLRPLIFIGERFFWGPHSARKSGIIWSNVPRERRLPADMQAPSVLRVLVEEKRRVENGLVAKAAEIVLRHAEYSEQNVRLHRRDRNGEHPEELGDYDILAFDLDANFVLIVECKDVSGAYCLKDARRLRERIFGRPGENGGQVGRVERRHEYLSANLARVADVLGWAVDPGDLPRIVSLFVSRVSYWWTAFPPRPTHVMFSRIDMLDDALAKLRGRSGTPAVSESR